MGVGTAASKWSVVLVALFGRSLTPSLDRSVDTRSSNFDFDHPSAYCVRLLRRIRTVTTDRHRVVLVGRIPQGLGYSYTHRSFSLDGWAASDRYLQPHHRRASDRGPQSRLEQVSFPSHRDRFSGSKYPDPRSTNGHEFVTLPDTDDTTASDRRELARSRIRRPTSRLVASLRQHPRLWFVRHDGKDMVDRCRDAGSWGSAVAIVWVGRDGWREIIEDSRSAYRVCGGCVVESVRGGSAGNVLVGSDGEYMELSAELNRILLVARSECSFVKLRLCISSFVHCVEAACA